jgi:hypothetical protein
MSNHYAIEGHQTVTGVLVTVTNEPLFTRDDDAPRPVHDGGKAAIYEVTVLVEGPGVPTPTAGLIHGCTGRALAVRTAAVHAVEGLRRGYGRQFGPVTMRVGHVANLATGVEAELFAGEFGDLADPAFAPMLALLDQTSPSAGALREAERLTGVRFGTF